MPDSELPIVQFDDDATAVGRWWTTEADDRILCQLCPRNCRLKPGDRGFCFVRANRNGKMVLDTYGRSTGFCIDPIEKKPLNHFLPGTPVLSFGTAGCNLGCKFCQNWDISKSREVSRLSSRARPEEIAGEALRNGCRSVAFTYNDPVIWAEYALDTASACHQLGLKTVAVTAGYLTKISRADFFSGMDAANIDLKAFTEEFYFKLTGAHLMPVLDTIRYACRETDCWVELTNLIIPSSNDNLDDLKRMVDWILDAVGNNVPIHFTAFHPDFRMKNVPATSHETLVMAYDLARQAGLNFVYVGNVNDVARQSTYCPSCNQLLIERNWHQLGTYALRANRCLHCDHRLPGVFETAPGNWGRRRQPIQIGNHSLLPTENQTQRLTPTPTAPSSTMTSKETISEKISDHELHLIHRVACQFISSLLDPPCINPARQLDTLADHPVSGIYVTLKRGATLRGCCGMQGPPIPLSAALTDAATRTALHDPRMAPVTAVELPHLTLSISIIGPPRPIEAVGDDRIEMVHVGVHGLRIRLGKHVGLLLPVVAKEQDWNARQFLDAVCQKAGLPPGSWRRDDAVIEIFDGIDYSAPFVVDRDTKASDSALLDTVPLQRLNRWVEANLAALQAGATPMFYANDVDDATTAGVVLQVSPPDSHETAGWMQLNVREGIPLQSTLFQLTQTAARTFSNWGRAGQWQVNLGILSQVIHHGVDTDYQVQEVSPKNRAIIAMDGKRWAIAYQPSTGTDEVITSVLKAQSFRPGQTMIYSAVCDSTQSGFSISAGPQARSDITSRPPAVAGTFYPADDQERNSFVDEMLKDLSKTSDRLMEPIEVPAAMVPHAGLRYSGKIASDVMRRIKFPSSVLIIGPKHTSDGVDWAVAPHSTWQLSNTTTMQGDVDLAKRIVERVPGMQLDSVAHAGEHGIEVQLPLLYRIAPRARVAAIAMSGGSFMELERAATSLADSFADLNEPPLLLISSDMNHFADDDENRRRDRLALDQLRQLDPRGLLDTCDSENISMCGQIPAAFALLTLQALKQQVCYQEIAYGTSAETSGDKSRVVGYAGLLFHPC